MGEKHTYRPNFGPACLCARAVVFRMKESDSVRRRSGRRFGGWADHADWPLPERGGVVPLQNGPRRFRMPEDGPVFVTGAAGGIGSRLVDDLVATGHRVCAADLNESKLKELSARWGSNAHTIAFDITDSVATRDALLSAVSDVGVPYGLVNIAGNNKLSKLADITDSDWRFLLDVNLSSTFYACRALMPLMAEAGGGRVINTSSIFGLRGQPNDAAYSAAKAGVAGLTRALAVEFAPSGVTVNHVAPVATLTERVAGLDPQHLEAQLARIPLGRFSEVEDVTAAFRFLLEASSGFFTGQVLSPNGGDWMP